MKKYLPIVLSFVAGVAPLLSPVVQGFYSKHAAGVAIVGSIWATIKYLLPSPLQSNS